MSFVNKPAVVVTRAPGVTGEVRNSGANKILQRAPKLIRVHRDTIPTPQKRHPKVRLRSRTGRGGWRVERSVWRVLSGRARGCRVAGVVARPCSSRASSEYGYGKHKQRGMGMAMGDGVTHGVTAVGPVVNGDREPSDSVVNHPWHR